MKYRLASLTLPLPQNRFLQLIKQLPLFCIKNIKIFYRWLDVIYTTTCLFGYYLFFTHHFTQPLYNFSVIKSRRNQRLHYLRADSILEAIQDHGQGGRILTLFCENGFLCHYFAERNYVADGVDESKINIHICRLLQRINKKKTHFFQSKLSTQFLNHLNNNQYDFLFFTHHFDEMIKQLQPSQAEVLLKTLSQKAPILFIETAQPYPKIEEIFKKCEAIDIRKIRSYPHPERDTWQTLYCIKKTKLHLCGKTRSILHYKFTAHAGTGYFGRVYYDCDDVFIKRYLLPQRNNDLKKIELEIKTNNMLPENNYFPRLLEWKKDNTSIDLVFTKLPGNNLQELLINNTLSDPYQIVMKVIASLKFLLTLGIYHNDIRVWNINIDQDKTYLFDLEKASTIETENTTIALLWLIEQLTQRRKYKLPHPLTHYPAFDFSLLDRPMISLITNLRQYPQFSEFLKITT